MPITVILTIAQVQRIDSEVKNSGLLIARVKGLTTQSTKNKGGYGRSNRIGLYLSQFRLDK